MSRDVWTEVKRGEISRGVQRHLEVARDVEV